VYQAHFAIGGLKHKANRTGIIFGFLAQVLGVAKHFHCSELVFCWDSRYSKRRDLFPEYKASRRTDLTEEEKADRKTIHQAMDKLRKTILPQMGFSNIIQRKGYEADDLIARIALDSLDNVVIVSSDKDLYQLLFHNIRIWSPSKHQLLTPSWLRKTYDVSCSEWAMVKTLSGCPTDGVPPLIRGVGIKTAIKRIRGNLSPKSKINFKIDAAMGESVFDRNRRLVVLPFEGLGSIQIVGGRFNVDGFKAVCRKYGFRSFLRKERLEEWKSAFVRKLNRGIQMTGGHRK
jgi:5'-3' exonuclease